ncbi:MAG: GNAT family N-acetyltransferase [Bacteroidales bacterium]|nr:GNAT family N-acetyltransferase [Bacteroidales bacterium]
MEHQILIKSCWTDNLTTDFKNDFVRLANTVFGNYITEKYYRKKFSKNIYGPSLITIAYVDGRPAGTDVMWRNDLGRMKAYQTVDTCVLERFRGMGLLKKLTWQGLDVLGPDAFVYGFPNTNSFMGYVKMGWEVRYLYKTYRRPCTGDDIDAKYAAWWMKCQTGIGHIQVRGNYYLVRKKKPAHMATLIGRVDDAAARLFPEEKGIWILSSFAAKPSIYNRNKTIPLVCNKPKMEVPYWKIDAI